MKASSAASGRACTTRLLRVAQRVAAHGAWCDRLERPLREHARGSPTYRYGVDQVIELLRADPHGRVRFDDLHRALLLDLEQAQHLAHGPVVVRAEVLVYEHEHMLLPEQGVVAAQLLDVVDQRGVLQQLRAVRATRDLPPGPPLALELDRAAQVPDALDMRLQQLQVQRAQEARGLAQDRHDACLRLDLGDRGSRGGGPQVGGGCLARTLRLGGAGEQAQVLRERLRELTGHRRPEARPHVAREEPRLLRLGHEDLRVAAQHLVQRSRAALGVADDEEVRHARAVDVARCDPLRRPQPLLTARGHSPTRSPGRGRGTR